MVGSWEKLVVCFWVELAVCVCTFVGGKVGSVSLVVSVGSLYGKICERLVE